MYKVADHAAYDGCYYWQPQLDVISQSYNEWAKWASSEEDLSPRSTKPLTPFRDAAARKPSSPKTPGPQDFKFEESKKWADQMSDTASTVSTLADLPPVLVEEQLKVENTFVTVKSPSARRRSSCPPRIRTPCTVMLRHLPNRAKQARIEDHVHSLGFKEYTLHLPIDARTGVNKGYCFIRFFDEETAAEFCRSVHETQLPAAAGSSSGSSKRLMAVLAANQAASLHPRY